MWAPSGGTWAVSLDAETNSNVYGQSTNSSSTAFVSANGDVTWRDVRVELDFKVLDFNGSSSSYVAGACVRVSDGENFYLAGLRSDGRVGVRRFGSSNNNLDSSDAIATANVWYHLRVDAIGSNLTVFLDGMQVLAMTDTSHATGGVGVCTAHASAVFDNIVVTAP
jgi:pectate lyase